MTLKSNDYYEGVRAAIAAMDEAWSDQPPAVHRDSCMVHSWRIGHDAIEALLPKPDPAKVLVERYDQDGDCRLHSENWPVVKAAFQWLIDQGIIDPDKVK